MPGGKARRPTTVVNGRIQEDRSRQQQRNRRASQNNRDNNQNRRRSRSRDVSSRHGNRRISPRRDRSKSPRQHGLQQRRSRSPVNRRSRSPRRSHSNRRSRSPVRSNLSHQDFRQGSPGYLNSHRSDLFGGSPQRRMSPGLSGDDGGRYMRSPGRRSYEDGDRYMRSRSRGSSPRSHYSYRDDMNIADRQSRSRSLTPTWRGDSPTFQPDRGPMSPIRADDFAYSPHRSRSAEYLDDRRSPAMYGERIREDTRNQFDRQRSRSPDHQLGKTSRNTIGIMAHDNVSGYRGQTMLQESGNLDKTPHDSQARKKKPKTKKCPVCLESTPTLRKHAEVTHLPKVLWEPEPNKAPCVFDVYHALMELAKRQPQFNGDFHEFLEPLNKSGFVDDSHASITYQQAMKNLCIYLNWHIPDKFVFRPMNSPALLLHWRPLLWLLMKMSPKNRWEYHRMVYIHRGSKWNDELKKKFSQELDGSIIAIKPTGTAQAHTSLEGRNTGTQSANQKQNVVQQMSNISKGQVFQQQPLRGQPNQGQTAISQPTLNQSRQIQRIGFQQPPRSQLNQAQNFVNQVQNSVNQAPMIRMNPPQMPYMAANLINQPRMQMTSNAVNRPMLSMPGNQGNQPRGALIRANQPNQPRMPLNSGNQTMPPVSGSQPRMPIQPNQPRMPIQPSQANPRQTLTSYTNFANAPAMPILSNIGNQRQTSTNQGQIKMSTVNPSKLIQESRSSDEGGLSFFCHPETLPDPEVPWMSKSRICVGLHPRRAVDIQPWKDQVCDKIINLVKLPHTAAVGPIGLDRSLPISQWLQQDDILFQILKSWLEPSADIFMKPVILCIRGQDYATDPTACDAYGRALQILLTSTDSNPSIHILDFTSTEDVVDAWTIRFQNCYFGITGKVKFFNDRQRAAIKKIPLDRLILEMDVACLVGEDDTSKKLSLEDIAKIVSSIRGAPVQQLIEQTTVNSQTLYRRV